MSPAPQVTIEEAASPVVRLAPSAVRPLPATEPEPDDPDILRRSFRCPSCKAVIPRGTDTKELDWRHALRCWAHLPSPQGGCQSLLSRPSASAGFARMRESRAESSTGNPLLSPLTPHTLPSPPSPLSSPFELGRAYQTPQGAVVEVLWGGRTVRVTVVGARIPSMAARFAEAAGWGTPEVVGQ